jgi:hypothetical protein
MAHKRPAKLLEPPSEASLDDSKAASPFWLSSKNESLTRLEGEVACQVSRCLHQAEKEAYVSLSLTLVQSLKRLRIEAKCDEDEACVGSATEPYRNRSGEAVRNARRPTKISTRFGGRRDRRACRDGLPKRLRVTRH